MNVLLVNIKSKASSFIRKVPLALLKLSTYYKKKGYNVEFIDAGKVPKLKPDIICFSTIFLFNVKREIGYIKAYKTKFPEAVIRVGGISASLKSDLFKEHLGNDIDLHIGLCADFDNEKPDYEIAGIDFSYGFTSRGCVNKCKWCVVPKIEGKLSIVENWENCLHKKHKLFIAMDNNVLALGPKHFDKVLYTIYNRKMRVDFNQALDCVLFAKNEDFAKIASRYPRVFQNIRFAWDSKRQDESVHKTIDLILRYKLKSTNRPLWYSLYGFKDSPEIVFERWKYLLENKQFIKPMKYRHIGIEQGSKHCGGAEDIISKGITSFFLSGYMTPNDLYLFNSGFDNFMKAMIQFHAFLRKIKRGIKATEARSIFNKILEKQR